jgi:hypothetical protein
MSKIALTPSATGTGVFTISSPATNTNRSLTLPDEAGTVLTSASSLASDNLTGAVTVSSGNVGIGVTPSAWGAVIRALQINTTGMSLFTYTAGGTTDQYAFLTNNSYQNSGYADTYVRTNPAAQYRQLNNIHAWYNAPSGTAGTTISFTQAMTLDSSGNLLVGTTTVGLQNNMSCGFVGLDTTSYAVINHTSGTGGGNYYAAFGYNGSAIGSITQNGTTGVSYNTSSDYRLKTDAQPMVGASDRVLALKPVNFEWISDGSRVDGFLAHEAQEIVPECVTGTKDAMRDEQYEVTAAIEATYDEDGNELTAAVEAVMGTRSVPDMQGIDQSKLVPLLTAALQEALTEISALKVRVAALEAV